LRELLPDDLTESQKKTVFLQILRGVAAAHRCNIIHRDLKPENVLVGKIDETGEPLVKLIDFGISKFKEHRLTVASSFFGSFEYMAPETLGSPGTVDARADIYSLGHILYELATGMSFARSKGWKGTGDLLAYLKQQPPPEEGADCRGFQCDLF